ncbi:MAG: tetratricopeptide repeat protein [Pseudomonadota bacterium]
MPWLLAGCTGLALLLGSPLIAAPGEDAIAEAEEALARQDGVAAELAGKRALEAGAPRSAVAALIGEGELLQGDLADARQWLGPAAFDARTHDRGYQALAKLEIASNDLVAADAALNEVLTNGTPTAALWVDIGRLRYRAGGHQAALAAARQAIALEANDPAALEFMAQLTTDAQGPVAALGLFRQALRAAPDDLQLAAHYAATLGDAGQHGQMLAVVRAIVEENPDQPQAYYLQAILAARAGDDDLARKLWWRTDGAFDETPVGLLVAGVLEYRSGNPALAVERFAQLSRLQPLSIAAQVLFARALVANGDANVAIPILEPLAEREDASAYVLVLLARAYEQIGLRADAAPLLDRAALMDSATSGAIPALWLRDEAGRTRNPDDPVQQLRELGNTGRLADAAALVAAVSSQFDGSVDLQMVAGDIALLRGDSAGAMAQYRQAATIRSNWPLAQRMVAVLAAQGDAAAARRMLAAHLRNNPREAQAAALLGRMERDAGNRERAIALLRHAAAIGSGPSDPFLLGDLAELEERAGNREQALDHARGAQGIAPANRRLSALVLRLQGA